MTMVQTKKSIALVYAVDQLLDYYELAGKPFPDTVSVDDDTYAALCRHCGCKQLTHYRKVYLNIVNKNSKT